MKNILVTGAAGFIGANFAELMVKKYEGKYNIVVYDKLTYAGNIHNLDEIKDKITFVQGDICDFEFVKETMKKYEIDAIVHFAAESHVDNSIKTPFIFTQTNVIGTQVLLDACRKYGVLRYHQISTDEVYGDLPLDRPELRFVESTPLSASSPYSASKAAADLLVGAYYRTYGIPVTISRCSNNYGPRQFPEKLIPRMILCALAAQQLPIYGRGINVRDWIYVEDHCRAVDLIIRNGKVGEIYNIGGNCEKTNIEIVKLILQKMSQDESLIVHVADRAGHDLRYAIDSSKILKELGWKPKMNFEVGIEQTIQWYLENESL